MIEACGWFTVGGIPVARMGDRCTCPKKGHNNCVIVEGDPNMVIDGVPVALEGHKLSCGAVLISSMPNMGRVDDGMGAVISSQSTKNSVATNSSAAFNMFEPNPYDEQVDLSDDFAPGLPYFIQVEDGRTFSGRVDRDGKLPRIDTDGEATYLVLWGDEALQLIEGA